MRTTRRATALSAALLTVLGTAAPALAVTAPAIANGTAHNLRIHLHNSTSSNWSGYAATGGGYTSVSASWVQPSVNCGSASTWSSFWVGLDGDGSNSVEQTGTEADCSGGQAVYSSWYEMYPKAPVNYSDTVRPGDTFTASVTFSGSSSYTMTLTDVTQGWTRTTTKSSSRGTRYSAEVIAEAPSSSSGVLPLSDFGTVNFTNSQANGQPLGTYNPDSIDMASGGTTKATTSSLSNGTNFSVTWRHS